jgi:hypothetical protein
MTVNSPSAKRHNLYAGCQDRTQETRALRTSTLLIKASTEASAQGEERMPHVPPDDRNCHPNQQMLDVTRLPSLEHSRDAIYLG